MGLSHVIFEKRVYLKLIALYNPKSNPSRGRERSGPFANYRGHGRGHNASACNALAHNGDLSQKTAMSNL